jgi:hypothetical protein
MSAPRRILNSIFTDNPVRLSEVVDSELKSRIGSLLESKKLQVVSEMFDSGDFSPNAIKESVKSNRQKLRESVISAIAEEINESEVEEGIVDRYFTKAGRAHAAARDILKSIKHAKKTKRVAKEKDVKESNFDESILDRFYSRQSKERKQPAAKGLKFKTKTKRVAKAQDKE